MAPGEEGQPRIEGRLQAALRIASVRGEETGLVGNRFVQRITSVRFEVSPGHIYPAFELAIYKDDFLLIHYG